MKILYPDVNVRKSLQVQVSLAQSPRPPILGPHFLSHCLGQAGVVLVRLVFATPPSVAHR